MSHRGDFAALADELHSLPSENRATAFYREKARKFARGFVTARQNDGFGCVRGEKGHYIWPSVSDAPKSQSGGRFLQS